MAICDNTAKKAFDALKILMDGNKNFVAMDLKSIPTKERLTELADGQNPYVAILSCSDSRVPVEIIFDAGLGDIFVVRNAGNVLNDHVIGSLEYAVMSLGVRLVIILGHEECGVIKAVVKRDYACEYMKAFAETFAEDIAPALHLAKEQSGDLIVNTTKNNAILSARELVKRNEVLANLSKNQDLVIMPAYYSISTGRVDFLSEYQISKKHSEFSPIIGDDC